VLLREFALDLKKEDVNPSEISEFEDIYLMRKKHQKKLEDIIESKDQQQHFLYWILENSDVPFIAKEAHKYLTSYLQFHLYQLTEKKEIGILDFGTNMELAQRLIILRKRLYRLISYKGKV
jgi:hypothetical protein